jgi:hypothetical protein
VNRGHQTFMIFRTVLVSMILTVYVLGAIGFNVLHEIIHDHPEQSHSLQQEKDLCHRALFHQDKSHGCKHTTHISKVDKCNFSHTLFSGYTLPGAFSIGKELINTNYFHCNSPIAVLSESHSEITLRGPPAL